MYNQDWMSKNLQQQIKTYNDLEHKTINFIDDSNSVNSFVYPSKASEYLDKYFRFLKRYVISGLIYSLPQPQVKQFRHEICHSLWWDTPGQMFWKSSTKLIMNNIEAEKQVHIVELIQFSRSRTSAKITIHYSLKTYIYSWSTNNQLTQLMTQLPDELKTKTKKDRITVLKCYPSLRSIGVNHTNSY